MPSAHLNLKEAEVVKLVLEFLQNRELHITQLSLERETGVINGVYSDDMLFLRQLILDGQWDDVLEFVQPLESLEGFSQQQFHYIVYKHKYIELLCIKAEAGARAVQTTDVAVDEIVKCLNELEKCAPTREEYSNMCLLLTLPRLADHSEYKNWNPSSARVECFRAIYPLVEKYLPVDKKQISSTDKDKDGLLLTAKNDRLVQLLIKGLLYEYCVEYCQHKATSTSTDTQVLFGGLLDGTGFTDADLSLPSWLHCIPPDIFSCPFEQRTLNVDIERLEKPSLEASWTEYMLVTPIKPKTFPHCAMPSTRPRSAADIMSRSLNPHLDGLPFGLASQHQTMALSVGDLSAMSKSFASFHLTGKKSMNTSVDRLFEEADVFTSSSYGDLPSATRTQGRAGGPSSPPPVPPPRRPRSKSPEKKPKTELTSNVNSSTFAAGNTRPSRKESKDGKILKETENEKPANDALISKVGSQVTPELYKEYQRQKTKLQELEAVQQKQNEDYMKFVLENQSRYRQIIDNRLKEAIMSSDGSNRDTGVPRELLAVVGSPLHLQMPDSAAANRSPGTGLHNTSTPKGGKTPSANVTQTVIPLSPVVQTSKSVDVPASHTGGQSISSQIIPQQSLSSRLGGGIGNNPSSGGTPVSNQSRNHQQISQGKFENDSLTVTRTPLSELPVPNSTSKAKHGYVGQQQNKTLATGSENGDANGTAPKPRFIPVTSLEDVQAIRAAEFHPNGKLYAIGSNSKTLRICSHPKVTDLREDHQAYQPSVLFKRTKHHKGSIYCLAWNATGDLLATGSNDKTVKLMKFNSETCNLDGDDIELTMHDGTVRDMCFIEDLSNKSSLLISGGAGDCKIYVTDCVTGTPFQALSGHSGHILSLYTWGGAMFVSGSQDRTIRFWDLRTRGCVNLIPSPSSGTGAVKGSPVAAVTVDPSGRMLVSGQEDASCMLYDIRGNRIIQVFKPHTADIRTIRFSPRAYYLLTGSYDNKVILTDLQGDLTLPLPSVVVANHQDKVIQCRWHPSEFSFLSTSADKTAVLWGLPAN